MSTINNFTDIDGLTAESYTFYLLKMESDNYNQTAIEKKAPTNQNGTADWVAIIGETTKTYDEIVNEAFENSYNISYDKIEFNLEYKITLEWGSYSKPDDEPDKMYTTDKSVPKLPELTDGYSWYQDEAGTAEAPKAGDKLEKSLTLHAVNPPEPPTESEPVEPTGPVEVDVKLIYNYPEGKMPEDGNSEGTTKGFFYVGDELKPFFSDFDEIKPKEVTGYKFTGWALTIESTTIDGLVIEDEDSGIPYVYVKSYLGDSKSVTATAQWVKIDDPDPSESPDPSDTPGPSESPDPETKYKVTFNANGGSVTPTSATTNEDGKLASLPTPTRSGYEFSGWYTAISGGTKVTTDTVFEKDTIIYAHWTEKDKNPDSSNSPEPSASPEPSTSPTPGGTTTSNPSYTVSNGSGSYANGAWTSDKSSAKKGDTVTITATPNSGYKVDRVTVRDANGNLVAVTDLGGNKYSFTMSGSKVTVSVTFTAKTVTPVNPFVDVQSSTYYYDAVLWAYENGVTTGTGDGTTFSPTTGCTRAQFVTFLYRAAGEPAVSSSTVNKFSDVSATTHASYYNAILWAAENGITAGTGDGTTFSPNAVVTRAQSVTFMYRYAKQANIATKTGVENFDDVTNTGAMVPYYDAIGWAVANGITNGNSTTANTFGPMESCQRGMMVTFLYRLFTDATA